jgi:hypothetical protein
VPVLRSEKITSPSRQNLSYSERYFVDKFEEHDLIDNVAYTCDDTFSRGYFWNHIKSLEQAFTDGVTEHG